MDGKGHIGPQIHVLLRSLVGKGGNRVQSRLGVLGVRGRDEDTLGRGGKRRECRKSRRRKKGGCCGSGRTQRRRVSLCRVPRRTGDLLSRRLLHDPLGDLLHRPLNLETLELRKSGHRRHRLHRHRIGLQFLDAFHEFLRRFHLVRVQEAAAVKVAVHVGVAPVNRNASRNLGVEDLLRRVARLARVLVGDRKFVILVILDLCEFAAAAAQTRRNGTARSIAEQTSSCVDGLVGGEGVERGVPMRVLRIRRHKGTELRPQKPLRHQAVLEIHRLRIHELLLVRTKPVDLQLPQGEANVIVIQAIVEPEVKKGIGGGSLARIRFPCKVYLGDARVLQRLALAVGTIEHDLRACLIDHDRLAAGPSKEQGEEVVGRLEIGPHVAEGDTKRSGGLLLRSGADTGLPYIDCRSSVGCYSVGCYSVGCRSSVGKGKQLSGTSCCGCCGCCDGG